jgi:flagellar basal body-associated protein FliL
LEKVPNAAIAKAKANLDQRRHKKKKQTWIIMGLLVAIALGLMATLYVVLSG